MSPWTPSITRSARWRASSRLLFMLPAFLLVGCMSWTPGWESAAVPPSTPGSAGEPSIEQAEQAFYRADSREALEEARSEVARILADGGASKRSLRLASEIEILKGAAYDPDRGAKTNSYRNGIEYAERAMATHPEFAAKIRDGAELAEAVEVLGAEYGEEMLLWVTGVSYYFKECLSGLGHLVNFRWMLRTSTVMDHLAAVAPELQHGAVPFSLGIYNIGLPRSAGGDLELAAEYLDSAVSQSGSSLLPRWGRAKYLWVKTGDEEAFRSDLEWVLAQDPNGGDSPYSWNAYFQRDAREMLANIDRWF